MKKPNPVTTVATTASAKPPLSKTEMLDALVVIKRDQLRQAYGRLDVFGHAARSRGRPSVRRGLARASMTTIVERLVNTTAAITADEISGWQEWLTHHTKTHE